MTKLNIFAGKLKLPLKDGVVAPQSEVVKEPEVKVEEVK